MTTTVQHEPPGDGGTKDLGRRGFLSKAGTAALAMPLTTSLVVSASSVPALAKSPYGGHGGGHKPKHKGPKRRRVKYKVKHKFKHKTGRR
jgi:hypothetical protein